MTGWPDCIEWNGTRDKWGYGKTKDGLYAHRWVLKELGVDIAGKTVMHRCDNPPCINPAHLRVGTQADNLRDMFAKGRNRNGNELITHCPQGHEYSEENTKMNGTRRVCRTCAREYAARIRQQRRQERLGY